MESIEHIPVDEHVFIAGKTGSGKSKLAEVYLAGFDSRVVKLDTKGEVYERRKKDLGLWYELEEGTDFVVCETLEEVMEAETLKIIYVPDPTEQNEESYNDFFKWCYDSQDITVWVDEMMSISTPQRYPFYLKACWTRGRSRSTAIWTCTQRPMDIPILSLTQSTHFFIFNLKLLNDRKRVAETTGSDELMIPPKGHDFWYFYDEWDEPIMARLKLKKEEE